MYIENIRTCNGSKNNTQKSKLTQLTSSWQESTTLTWQDPAGRIPHQPPEFRLPGLYPWNREVAGMQPSAQRSADTETEVPQWNKFRLSPLSQQATSYPLPTYRFNIYCLIHEYQWTCKAYKEKVPNTRESNSKRNTRKQKSTGSRKILKTNENYISSEGGKKKYIHEIKTDSNTIGRQIFGILQM